MKIRISGSRRLLVGIAVGVGAATVIVASASVAVARTGVTNVTGAPGALSHGQLYALDSAPVALSWPDANATLEPFVGDTSMLVSAVVAEKTIDTALTNVEASSALSGTPTAGLYSYSNSSYGAIQPDGSVKLAYKNMPVWEFNVPLSTFADDSQGGKSPVSENVTRTGCSFYFIVQASDGSFLTSGQECSVSDSDVPTPVPGK